MEEKSEEKKKKITALITAHRELARGIFGMWTEFPPGENTLERAVPGQFFLLTCREGGRLLPRPISICDIDGKNRMVYFVYRVSGAGTVEFSKNKPGETIDVLGPLGNGYVFDGKAAEGKATDGKAGQKTSLLIGGGIGIPPLLFLAKKLPGEKTIVLGYNDAQTFLAKDFSPYGTVIIATQDGSVGIRGNVTDALQKRSLTADEIFACGPLPLLKVVKAYAVSQNIPAQISMEERMACGIGACLGCVCASAQTDAHSHVKNKRVCKDGPVFAADEIDLG